MYLLIYLDANFVQWIFIFIQHFFQNFEDFFFCAADTVNNINELMNQYIINLSIYSYCFFTTCLCSPIRVCMYVFVLNIFVNKN